MRQDWESYAACKGLLDIMFDPYRVIEAKEVCSRCTVTDECLSEAIRTNSKDGVWGGKSAEERQTLPDSIHRGVMIVIEHSGKVFGGIE